MEKIIMSGIQPTGNLHLGNYFGAIQNWVKQQKEYQCFFTVVNYHAITMPYNTKKLGQMSWELIYKLIACGVRTENLFIQSMVPEHTELAWILNCFCSYGDLARMTQFKDKSTQVKEGSKDAHVSVGIFTYPVLQAADILIYHANHVPVGKDQEQHLELTRRIAQRFNQVVGKEYFPIVEPLYTSFAKIRSTADPAIKMSSSKGDKHNINLFAEPKRIRKQIMSAVTDAGDLPTDQMSLGVENLFTLLKACEKQQLHDDLLSNYRDGNLRYGDLKNEVAESIITYTAPFRERSEEIAANKAEVKKEVKSAAAEIRKVAQNTLREVKELAGLV